MTYMLLNYGMEPLLKPRPERAGAFDLNLLETNKIITNSYYQQTTLILCMVEFFALMEAGAASRQLQPDGPKEYFF